MNKKRKILLSFAIIFLVLASGSLIYLSISQTPLAEVNQYLESDEKVTVSGGDGYEFRPVDSNSSLNATGFILYPGGKVPPASYAALGYELAARGLFTAIPKMPFNLAIFSPNAAQTIIDAHPEISTWIIGGHSLGGTMAAKFVYDNPSVIQALVLLAAYPTDSNNLSARDLDVLLLYGTYDEVLSKDISDILPLLPADTVTHEIVGGNHAYFGMYGEQNGDGVATISNEAQINETITSIWTFANSTV